MSVYSGLFYIKLYAVCKVRKVWCIMCSIIWLLNWIGLLHGLSSIIVLSWTEPIELTTMQQAPAQISSLSGATLHKAQLFLRKRCGCFVFCFYLKCPTSFFSVLLSYTPAITEKNKNKISANALRQVTSL